jgi:heterodisulfide reductase subunit A-like polyferredoxin
LGIFNPNKTMLKENNEDVRRDGMTNDKSAPTSGSIMVVGGGISGLTTAIEAAEVGYQVFLRIKFHQTSPFILLFLLG